METTTKLPLLRFAALPDAMGRSNNNRGGRDEDGDPDPLPPLASPSRAARLLFNSVSSSSAQSVAALKRGHPRSGSRPRARPIQPEDFAKSPLELATEQLRASRERISTRLAQLSTVQAQFACEEPRLAFVTQQLRGQQRMLAALFARFFDVQARQIQRVFRGHRGRRMFRQLIAVRAVLRIQRAFRAARRRRDERRKRLRLLCRKVLRGLRSVRERHELAHHELLSRVNHNLLIEAQWRRAMGIDDAESDFMTALYRKRYVRRRLIELLRRANALRSIVNYWRGLVPRPTTAEEDVQDKETGENRDENTLDDLQGSGEEDDGSDGAEDEPSIIVIRKAQTPARGPRNRHDEALGRSELLRRQRTFTGRVQEESQKREVGNARVLDRQRELTQLSDNEKRAADEQRRKERARALQMDLERRGLRSVRELQAKKEHEAKLQQEAQQRAAQARRAIAAQVLSPETKQRMIRQARRQEQKRT